jgi:hypothetical protein
MPKYPRWHFFFRTIVWPRGVRLWTVRGGAVAGFPPLEEEVAAAVAEAVAAAAAVVVEEGGGVLMEAAEAAATERIFQCQHKTLRCK